MNNRFQVSQGVFLYALGLVVVATHPARVLARRGPRRLSAGGRRGQSRDDRRGAFEPLLRLRHI
jgi:hypothetical protein